MSIGTWPLTSSDDCELCPTEPIAPDAWYDLTGVPAKLPRLVFPPPIKDKALRDRDDEGMM